MVVRRSVHIFQRRCIGNCETVDIRRVRVKKSAQAGGIMSSRLASAPASGMVSVYDGTDCLGHVLHRPRVGFEAYDSNDKLIGLFESQREAASALMSKP